MDNARRQRPRVLSDIASKDKNSFGVVRLAAAIAVVVTHAVGIVNGPREHISLGIRVLLEELRRKGMHQVPTDVFARRHVLQALLYLQVFRVV